MSTLNKNFKIRDELRKQSVRAGESLKTPEKTSLDTAGDSIANKSEVILNNEDGQFYGHNGKEWIPLGGGGGDPCGICVHESLPLTPEDISRRADADFDYIIVGAGTSGCALAYKLVQLQPDKTICILEAGRDDLRTSAAGPKFPLPGTPDPNDPSYTSGVSTGGGDWGQFLRSPFDSAISRGMGGSHWLYEGNTNPNVTLVNTQPIPIPVGSTTGGTSAVNTSIWLRGTEAGTHNLWEEVLGEKWGFQNATRLYIELENRSQQHTLVPPLIDPNSPVYKQFDFATNGPDAINGFNENLHGNNGRLFITVVDPVLINSPMHAAIKQAAINVFGSDRFTMDVNWEDPKFDETISPYINTSFDQTDPQFDSNNQYPADTPLGTANPSVTQTQANILNNSNSNNIQYLRSIAGDFNPSNPGVYARSYSGPSFYYPLESNSMVTTIENAYVKKLVYNEEFNEITGVEYWSDSWNVNQIGRSLPKTAGNFSLDGATPADAKANAETVASDPTRNKIITARYDVIVCAGAIDTPAILQRSGIGSQEHLGTLDNPIKCINNLPGVGENLKDHPSFISTFKSVTPYEFTVPFPPNPVLPVGSIVYYDLFRTFPVISRLRLKSSPEKDFSDFTIVGVPNIGNAIAVSNQKWEDSQSLLTYTYIDDGQGYDTYTWNTRYIPGTTVPGVPTSDADAVSSPYIPTPFDTITGPYKNRGDTGNPADWPDARQLVSAQIQNLVSKSTGSVKIVSDDPSIPPYIHINLAGSEEDIDSFVNVFKNNYVPLIEGLGNTTFELDPANPPFGIKEGTTPNFSGWIDPPESVFRREITVDDDGNLLSPPENVFNEVGFRDWLKTKITSGNHRSSTCKMGRPTDVMAVCDNHGRVYNIKALRCCDASIFPTSPDVNTQASCYFAAFNEAEIIAEDNAF